MKKDEFYIVVYYHNDWTTDGWTEISKIAHETEEEALEVIELQGYTLTEHGEYKKEDEPNGEFATVEKVFRFTE